MAVGNLQQLIPAIFTGPNGERLTPEQIAQRQEIAQSLIGRATDTSPDAGGWASVLTKGLLGYQSGAGQRAADNAIKANAESSQSSIAAMLNGIGLGGGAGYSVPVASGASPTGAVATGTPVSSGGTVSVPSAPEIRQGLIDRGLQPHIADAFILNFQDESGLNPGINEQNPTVPGSRGGYGLYQLTGPRRREYEAFASQRGVPLDSADAQLDFMMKEGSGKEKAAFDKILASPDTASAAQAIVKNFLRPAKEHQISRAAKYGRVATTPQEAIAQVAPQASPEMGSFDNRWNAGAVPVPSEPVVSPQVESPMPEMASAVMPQAAQQPQQGPSPSLLAQNDMMLGGALSPSGSSPVAQALSGSFPAAPSMQGQQSQGGINPAIVAALSNPYASQQERQIAGMLLGQQMEQAQAQQQQAQQMAQRQAAAGSLGIDPSMAGADQDTWKALIEQATRNRNTVTVGNTVYDANTGQQVIQGAPDPTSNMKNYDAYAGDERAAGRQPLGRLEYEQAVRKSGATNISNTIGGESLTPGQKKIDENFADTYLQWNQGGFADSRKQIDQLGEAVKILESGENVTGKIGLLPDAVRPFFNQKGAIARENVEEVVQRSLREILGAQFTEKEGERLIARAFNPLLPPKENAKRVRRLMTTIGSMADAKQDMVDYFDKNGTLRGYKGSRPTTSELNALADNWGKTEGEDKASSSTAPAGIDQKVWDVMTPEERALW